MALSEQIKKGGRYTKREQEERKLQVYHLHFEQEKPAVKIAEMLNVNRNTINEDIRYWHQQLANEMNAQDISAKMTKQIQRMEIQRDRLLDELEDAESLEERIKLERFISDIDNRLIGVYSKMIVNGKEHLPPTIKIKYTDEDEIKEFVRDLVLSDDDPDSKDVYSEDTLRFDFIRKKKCDIAYADRVIEKMKQDGLTLCKQSTVSSLDFLSVRVPDYSETYNLGKFANLRGYITIHEFDTIMEKRSEIRHEIEKDEEREEKFIQKYGPISEWSTEVQEMYDDSEYDIAS
jgi:hypothetical protein